MEIIDDKLYALGEIATKRIVPGMRSYNTLRKEVFNDLEKPKKSRTIDALVIGDGKHRTIRVKGENLKKLINIQKKKLTN